jgi:hypothetical protein
MKKKTRKVSYCFNRKIVERGKMDTPTQIYMTADFHGLGQALQ